MTRPLSSGIYRVRHDVVGPCGTARVERDAREPRDSATERYTVRYYAKGSTAPGALVALCYRYAIPEVSEAREAPTYDGGWQRALAIAEDITLGSAQSASVIYPD